MGEEELDRRRKNTGDGGGDEWLWNIAAAVIAAVLVLVPAALGVTLYAVLSRWLRRFEFALVGVFGVAAIVLSAGWAFDDYADWLVSFLPGGPAAQVLPPLLPVLLYALPFCSLLGIVAGTRVVNRLPGRRTRRWLKAHSPIDKPAILPSDRERERAVVTGPDGGLVVDASMHSPTRQQGEPGQRFVPLGINKHGETAGVTEFELGMHMLVMGSTGSGKSVTLQSLAAGLMDLGWHGLVLDLKEAGDLKTYFDEYCLEHRLPFQPLMLSDPAPNLWFNPLHGMRADSALDALMMTQRYGDNAAMWEAVNRRMAGQLLNLLYDAHEVDPTLYPFPTISDMGKALAQGTKLPSHVKKMVATVIQNNPARTKDDYQSLIAPDQKEAESATTLGTRLTNMLDTAAGRAILRSDPTRDPLDITRDGLTYVGLDTQGRPEMSQVMAGFLLQRVAVLAAERTIAAERGHKPKPRFLIVDEANQVKARPIILTLLQKARAAGITVILATQSPTDWIDDLGDDWDSMAQNCNAALVMSQGARGPAEMCAELLGKERFYTAGLEYVDGDVYDSGRLMEREDFRVTPDELRQLGIGESIIRVGKPRERIEWMQIKMRDPRAHARSGGGGAGGAHRAMPLLGGDTGPAGPGPTLLGRDDPPDGGPVGASMPTPQR